MQVRVQGWLTAVLNRIFALVSRLMYPSVAGQRDDEIEAARGHGMFAAIPPNQRLVGGGRTGSHWLTAERLNLCWSRRSEHGFPIRRIASASAFEPSARLAVDARLGFAAAGPGHGEGSVY